MKRITLFAALLALTGVVACEQAPPPKPVVLNYWRAISSPNVLLTYDDAAAKLQNDLAQCRCSNFPLNVPQNKMATIQPDLGRMAETSATKPDGCVSTPGAVLVECMRARGWEPTSCSGRLATSGGGYTCAVTVTDAPAYPDAYPYANSTDAGFSGSGPSPAEAHQNYPQ